MRAHHPRRHHSLWSCPRDRLEGFDKNYSRATNFRRPKLKLASVTSFGFSILEDFDRDGRLNLAPELGFQCIFVKIEVFVTLVPADASGTPPIDCKVFVGVFGMYSELIGAPVTPPAAENQKYTTISVAARAFRCTCTPLHGLC